MRTVAIVLALVLVCIGIFYAVSSPFKAKVDEVITQSTEWTAENIAERPQDYIRWATTESERVLQGTTARELAIAQLEGKWQARAEQLAEASQVGREALEELKQVYRDAQASGNWQVEWRERKVTSENDLKRQIIALHNEVEHNDSLHKQYTDGVVRLGNMREKVKEVQFKAQETIKNLQYALEELKLQEADDTLDTDLVAINSTLDVLRSESTEIGAVDLDTLVSEKEVTVDEEAFSEIMGFAEGEMTSPPESAPVVDEGTTAP